MSENEDARPGGGVYNSPTGLKCRDCPYETIWYPTRTPREKCKHDLVTDHTVDYVDPREIRRSVDQDGNVVAEHDEQAQLVTDGGDRTVVVDDELEEAVHWVERELREARRALWDGKSGKAFASIEAAQDEFETVEEAVLDG